MATNTLPTIGKWYKNKAGETFKVVAFDEDGGYIEIQYFDGTVEEQDVEYWNEQSLKTAEQPEDWSGSMDIERDDYGVDLESDSHLDWQNPLDKIEQ
jgi:hypothetical protein